MAIFIFLLVLIIMITSRKNTDRAHFLDKRSTTTMNGVFAILIFLSHSTQYMSLPNNYLDKLYLSFQNFHNQWVVTTFLAFSGFGVMTKIMTEGKRYVNSLPTKRIIKTLLNYDIAVIIYLLVDFILNIKYSFLEIIGSFIGLTSVGNSNWYIFTILIMYTLSFLAAKFFKNKYQLIIITVTVLSVVYTMIIHLTGLPSRFASTVASFPLGMFIAVYKDALYKRIEGYNKSSFLMLLLFLLGCVATYGLRGNIYLKNISSIFFVLIIVWFMAHFDIRSRVLYYFGEYAFAIYILQRLPMIVFTHFMSLNIMTNYVFVVLSLAVTVILAVFFEKLTNRVDRIIPTMNP